MSYQTYGSGSGVRQAYVEYPTSAVYGGAQTYGTTTYTTTGTTGYVAPSTTTYLSGPALTSTYVAPTTTYVAGPTTTTSYVSGPATTSYVAGQTFVSGGATRAVAEEIPVESRIEYIPFEKKYIEYDRVERIERVPFER